LGFLAVGEAGRIFPSSPLAMALLIGAGPVTLAPLLFFNGAARRLRLSTLGFFQYLSPSIQLLLAVAFFHEPFTGVHWAAFGCIWTALALYSGESLRRMRGA
jgi:chloramphenicol-sensitive protein RarD